MTADQQPELAPDVVSFSELASFRRCPLKHFLEYRERWTKPDKEGGALSRGTRWHSVLETHYETKRVTEEEAGVRTVAQAAELSDRILKEAWVGIEPLLFDLRSGEQTEEQNLVEWMYRGHVDKWGTDPEWKVLGTETRLQAPLPNAGGIELKAKVDLIVYDRTKGGTWVIDHKSGKSLPYQKELDIDDQFGLYTWLWNTLHPESKVMGSIHNAAKTYRTKAFDPLDRRFSRTYMNRTDTELVALAVDAAQAALASRTGLLYSSPNSANCKWDCSFVDAHLLARKGRDLTEVLREFDFVQNFERH